MFLTEPQKIFGGYGEEGCQQAGIDMIGSEQQTKAHGADEYAETPGVPAGCAPEGREMPSSDGFSDIAKSQASADAGHIVWPVRIPMQEEEAVTQEESLEEDLEPPGVRCQQSP